jgi:hypothetical protein
MEGRTWVSALFVPFLTSAGAHYYPIFSIPPI